MLRVTRSEEPGKTRFKLEGKLAACWVDVMEQCWKQAVGEGGHGPITVDLSAITYVDARGTDLLRQMHASGVELSATTCLGKGIVEQVSS
jgi:anti-anti-sigma regulatory factor